jgi:large subunit ribosomal protein L11
MQIKLLVEGGAMQPGPALSQKLGPAGVNLGQVISKVNDATKDFKGLKVPVELDVDMKTKQFEVQVFSPPASELMKKELGIEKGSGAQKKLYAGNASIEQIISVAKQKMPNLLAKDLKAAVKSIIGTCTSLGALVENKPASEAGQDVDEGKFDKEIQAGITETPAEKRAELDKYFSELTEQQQKIIKQEEAAKAAEAAAAAPAEGEAKPGEAAPVESGEAPAPTEEKK